MEILIGFTDFTKLVFIPDPASTDGSGKTGLVAANMTAAFARVETDNDVVVTDATSSLNDLAALTSAHNDWGMLEVSSTVMPGWYRLDFADACFASGAWSCGVNFMITTSAAAPAPMEFELVATNKLDGVRNGLTALPNAAAAAAGGLWILGSNNTAAITIGALTTGAIALTTLTASGAVAFQSTFAVTTSTALGAVSMSTLAASGTVTLNALTVTTNVLISGTTTFTGVVAATAANDIRGVTLSATGSAAMAELAGPPSSTPTLAQAVSWLYMASMNERNTTASTDEVSNAAGTTIGTAAISDDTVTFVKGKYA